MSDDKWVIMIHGAERDGYVTVKGRLQKQRDLNSHRCLSTWENSKYSSSADQKTAQLMIFLSF